MMSQIQTITRLTEEEMDLLDSNPSMETLFAGTRDQTMYLERRVRVWVRSIRRWLRTLPPGTRLLLIVSCIPMILILGLTLLGICSRPLRAKRMPPEDSEKPTTSREDVYDGPHGRDL